MAGSPAVPHMQERAMITLRHYKTAAVARQPMKNGLPDLHINMPGRNMQQRACKKAATQHSKAPIMSSDAIKKDYWSTCLRHVGHEMRRNRLSLVSRQDRRLRIRVEQLQAGHVKLAPLHRKLSRQRRARGEADTTTKSKTKPDETRCIVYHSPLGARV